MPDPQHISESDQRIANDGLRGPLGGLLGEENSVTSGTAYDEQFAMLPRVNDGGKSARPFGRHVDEHSCFERTRHQLSRMDKASSITALCGRRRGRLSRAPAAGQPVRSGQLHRVNESGPMNTAFRQ